MVPFISDAQFAGVVAILVAAVTGVPTTLAAYWAYKAKSTSTEAKQESAAAREDSAVAKEQAAAAAYEVMPNGGMGSPVPNLNDHVQYQTEMLEKLMPLIIRVDGLDTTLTDHLRQANIMFHAVAEMYLEQHGHLPRKFEVAEDQDQN